MEIKWIGSMLIMMGSICVSLWFRFQYLNRLSTTKEMQRGISILKGEIQYNKAPLPEVCECVAIRIRGSSQKLFQMVGERLLEGGGTTEQIWKDVLASVFEHRQLSSRDYEEVERLGNTLGYLDIELQTRTMELCMKRLEESISNYEKERKNQTRLYPLVGVFAGFILCLVLI